MASGEGSKQDHVVVREFPAPPGWTKKLVEKKPNTPKKTGTPQNSPGTPKKTGTPQNLPGTPKKTGTPQNSPGTPQNSPGTPKILWISPTGEEIRTVTQLQQYLRSHPGGPDITDFNWSITGYSPRRSARVIEKQKAVASPASKSPKKRRKSLLGAKAKSDADEEDKTTDEKDANAEGTTAEEDKGTDDDNAEETKETVGSSTTDAQDAGEASTEDKGKKAAMEVPGADAGGDAKAKKKKGKKGRK